MYFSQFFKQADEKNFSYYIYGSISMSFTKLFKKQIIMQNSQNHDPRAV